MASLFDKMRIGPITARNCIVRAATAESLATPAGGLSPELLGLYGELAWGGAGIIITGYMYVREDGKPSEGALGLHDDAHIARLRSLVEIAHENGAYIIAQLVYGGSKSKLAADDTRRLAPVDAPCEKGVPNTTIHGPSAIEHPSTHLVPTEATPAQLAEITRAFADAAVRARACGFDGVEVHAAHGYLLSQFLDGRFNERADEFGGSLENRARLAIDCVKAVRQATGAGYPVFVKLNSCDVWDDPAGARGGMSEDESAQVAKWLVDAGATCIDVTGDWHAGDPQEGPFFAAHGARLAAELDVPVIVTGGWRDPAVIEEHLQHDGIAGVALSRPLICEPTLPRRWRDGDMAPSKCTSCGACAKRPGLPCPARG